MVWMANCFSTGKIGPFVPPIPIQWELSKSGGNNRRCLLWKTCGKLGVFPYAPNTGFNRFFLGWIGLWFPVALGVARLVKIPWRYPIAPEHKLPLLLPLYLLAPVAVELYRRYGGGEPWANYGVLWPTHTLTSLVVGLGVAIFGVALLVGVQLVLGWRQWRPQTSARVNPPATSPLGQPSDLPANSPSHPSPTPIALLLALPILTLFIGWVEELIFRGVLVNGLLAALPWLAVVVLASAIFAVSHLVWDGPAGVPSLPGLGLMGLVLLLARWAMAGDLSLAWGLHTGWIFAIALIDALHLVQPVTNAPALAGKPDQPLTGLPALGLMVLTGLGIWTYTLWFR